MMTPRTTISGLVLCIDLALASLTSLNCADAHGITSPSATAAVAGVLARAVERGDTPGAVGLVVDRNGVLFEGASGKLDIAHDVPLGTDAIFNIASMTKPVTSVAIMMLLEQGKLALDDPVSKYLPGFDKLEVITKFNAAEGSYETRPAKRTMTLRHLLTHTSGIGYGLWRGRSPSASQPNLVLRPDVRFAQSECQLSGCVTGRCGSRSDRRQVLSIDGR
jgi:methyl acetate hydrolase